MHIECYSLDMLAMARSKIEKECKGLITHLHDSTKELDTLIGNPSNQIQKIKRCPLGVKNKKELDTELDRHYDSWVDTPLEILGEENHPKKL